jgi:hypothetical protein
MPDERRVWVLTEVSLLRALGFEDWPEFNDAMSSRWRSIGITARGSKRSLTHCSKASVPRVGH